MPTTNLPSPETPLQENIRLFFEPLKWHPDLAADLRECHAGLCAIAEESGARDYPAAQARCVQGILRRYSRIWSEAPDVGDDLARAVNLAITYGTWWAAVPVVMAVANAHAQSRRPRAMADTFADSRAVQCLAHEENNGLWSVPTDLPPGVTSELAGLPFDASRPHPAIVLHCFPGAKRADLIAAIRRILPEDGMLATVASIPGARSGKDGRRLDMSGKVALYRWWWEWHGLRKRLGQSATAYAFVRERDWEPQAAELPSELVRELEPHLKWFIDIDEPNNRQTQLTKLLKWMPPDPATPPVSTYLAGTDAQP